MQIGAKPNGVTNIFVSKFVTIHGHSGGKPHTVRTRYRLHLNSYVLQKEYVIAVSESEVVWTVQYRYSEILRFHNQVRIFHVVSINHYSKPIYP